MMENLFTLSFEAHNPARNHHRWYSIHVGLDLFGDWTIGLRYGRSGTRGREIRHSGEDFESVREILWTCLRRRLSAPKRIGCRYQLVEESADDKLLIEQWIPRDLLVSFVSVSEEDSLTRANK